MKQGWRKFMDRRVLVPRTGTRPGQPFSSGIRWERLVFCSGQTGADPVTREFPPDIREQTHLAIRRIQDVAVSGGASLESIVKVNIFLTDILSDFAAMNEVYRTYFPVDPPARSTVGVLSLARPGLKIEMEAIAIAID
jgi:2-iminobutanoate/2-iminopropanoate deaminase